MAALIAGMDCLLGVPFLRPPRRSPRSAFDGLQEGWIKQRLVQRPPDRQGLLSDSRNPAVKARSRHGANQRIQDAVRHFPLSEERALSSGFGSGSLSVA
jgi:hypothetical protein